MARRLFAVLATLAALSAIAGAAAALDVNGGTIQVFQLDAHVPTPTPQHGQAGTSIEAYKTAAGFSRDAEAGVRGEICVQNGGERPTEGLTISDIVQVKPRGRGKFQDLISTAVELEPASTLNPGEFHCYPYEIHFTPVDGAIYRNTAHIAITNHSGHLGEPFGPQPKADFSLVGDDHTDGEN